MCPRATRTRPRSFRVEFSRRRRSLDVPRFSCHADSRHVLPRAGGCLMLVTGRFARFVLMLVVVAVVFSVSTRLPRAQAPAVNLKQQLLAGGTLPVNVPAARAGLATLPRRAYAPGRVLVKMVDG